ncbi:hypothetical protein B795N_00730 [Marinilactibacillus psychrotolerans]|uniref:putative HNHc nuclease n=1 Tax=Marinilactibacillus psychrotolerans TaxID=191770 RepID=UPI001C7D5142|nr:putative HNHc nuclease [Marinilactibacillus psychrotolerans]GEQ32191.1 hypothetical protein B795N_00730 [Marinilactibacillus psychrotolerans]
MRGEIIGQKGDVLTVKLFDELDVKEVKKQAVNGRYYVYVDVFEKDSITDLQRKHFYALCGDIEDKTGYPQEVIVSWIKFLFMKHEGLPEYPSLATNQMKKTTASHLIEFTILFCIKEDIPFRKQQFYLTTDTSKMLYALMMKKICWVTGKPGADLHHAVNLVSMGNNRNKFDHLKSKYMRLSREAHQEAHTMGLEEFCQKYHVKPIKLSKSDLIELGVMNKKENEDE